MALLDKAYKQRMVGALVLVALAVIFLPMLFSRQDEQRQVTVEAPAAPQPSAMPQVQMDPVAVPEPQALPEEPLPTDEEVAEEVVPAAPAAAPAAPAPTIPAQIARPATPPPVAKPIPAPAQPITSATSKPDTTQSRVDANGLSVVSGNLPACRAVPAPRACRRTCAARVITPTFVRPMARIGCSSVR